MHIRDSRRVATSTIFIAYLLKKITIYISLKIEVVIKMHKVKSICRVCKDEFFQEENKDGSFTEYETCPICRKKSAQSLLSASTTKYINIPYSPHKTQVFVHDSKARFKILVCGNRWGKDLCSIADSIKKFIEMCIEDRPVTLNPKVHWWIIAPSENLAKQNWRDLKALFPKELIGQMQESEMTMKTFNDGLIEVRSAYDSQSLVGVGLDIATITEAARIPDLEATWTNIMQRLNSPKRGVKGKGGVAIINSTPNMENPRSNRFFYQLYQMGKVGSKDRISSYESFNFTTWDNPYMAEKRYRNINVDENGKPIGEPMTEEESIKASMSIDKYEQDYMAKFIFSGNAVFKNLDAVMVKPDRKTGRDDAMRFFSEIAKVDKGTRYFIGYDPAQKNDGHPLVVFNYKGEMVYADPLDGKDYMEQTKRVSEVSRIYNNAIIYYGVAGVGETLSFFFEKEGVTAIPVKEHGTNKRELVENLMLLIESGSISILDRYEIYDQLLGYIKVESKTGSTYTYQNGLGVAHDDWVSAIYIALSSFRNQKAVAPVYLGLF